MPRVLIVEDELEILELEKTILESQGFQVDIANNGADGLLRFKENKYDLVISDVMMPQIDGYKLCKRISELNAQNSGKPVPVIMVTAKSEPEDLMKGFDSGAVTYLIKPFTVSSLLAAVRTVLSFDPPEE